MKTISWITSLLFFLVCMGACKGSAIKPNATGAPSEVIVVMNDRYWDDAAGEALRNVLGAPVVGLPEKEPSLSVSHTDPNRFSGIYKVVRNILIVDIDSTQYTKVSVGYVKDQWARNQMVVKITAPTAAEFISYIEQHGRPIVDAFVKEEITRTQAYLQKKYSKTAQDKIKEMFGLEISIPEDMKLYRDTTDFFWTTNDAAMGRKDMVVYSFPYTDKNTFTKDYMIAMRDSVMKANIPGGFPGSYMTTQKKFITDYKGIEVNGEYVGELRGLWRVEGDKMGGPFVSHAMLDKKNQRVIVAEGFVFAPETNKRNYMRQLEGALFTMRLADEPEQTGRQTEK